MDYTTLTADKNTAGSIANWANSSQLQAAASTIVAEAEAFIYRRLRHWQMLVEVNGVSMATGNDNIGVPANFLEVKSFYITGVNFAKLTLKTEEEVKAAYQYDGSGNRVNQQPEIFYFNSTQIKFDSPPDQDYPYEFVYYGQPTPLSASNPTNFLTATYPRLMRCACMSQASEFMKDAGMGNYDRTYWDQAALAEIDAAQTESDRSRRAIEVGMILV